MAKAVEITFAIGAALAGSFAGTFGKAGKALSDFQKQAEQLQKQSGQIESYQKMQGAIVKNAAEMYSMTDQAEALNAQAAASKARTQDLSSQYRTAQQEASRLNAENVRNTDAYKAAKLNMESLAKQIKSSSQPTAELQKQYKAAQEEVRRLEGAMKQSSTALKAAQQNAQGLNRQMKESQRETKSLSDKSQELTTNADKLQQTIDRDKESLERMRQELRAAGIDTANLADEQARLTKQSQRMAEAQARYNRSKAALDQTRQNLSWNNMKGELMTAAGLGYSLYKPVSQAADFESAMARVNAVAFSGAGRDKEADAKSFKALQEQARQLGRDTQFTAVQAAQSQENLARAGFKANEIISAMPGLLNMAAAEGMDLAQASDIAASTLRGFKLSADQMNRVADVLAQTSAASNTNIVGLGEGMKYVAPVAANLGVSLEETAAMLGVMANAGIKGTEGGTALRGAFLRLAQEPKAVEKALNSLGVASRDAKGNMRQLPDIMLELSDKMKDMGEADKTKYLADIFGVRAVSGMMAVMNGALDGSLEQLRRYNYEATGELKAISEAVGVNTEKMWEGMKGSEPFMQRLGISFRDLSIYTAMLAKSNITGADANKTLTATFSQLAKNSNQVKKALKGYKISLFKDDGTMRDFPDLLNDINNAMKGMTDAQQIKALTKIFGKDAVPGIRAMMKEIGQGTFTELDKVADSASGVSKEMADKVINTLKGQMTIAGSAVSDLMIIIGNVLLPTVKEAVEIFTGWTSSLAKFAEEHPIITKGIVGTVGALSALKVGLVGVKIGWNLLKLPFQSARVAIDFLNLKLVAQGKASLFAAAKTKVLAAAQKSWQVVMKAGRGLVNVGKLVLYGAKSAVVAVAKGVWTTAEWLWVAAMKAGRGLLDVGRLVLYGAKTIAVSIATKAWAITQGLLNVAMKPFRGLLNVGKLVLYYGKQLLIAAATKAWTAAQWLWNAAMNANPIGLLITAIAGLIVAGYYLYKNWDTISARWSAMWSWLYSKASTVVESLGGVFASIGRWAKEYFKLDFSGMFTGLTAAVGSVWDTLKNLGNAIKSLFTLDFSGAWDSLIAALESIKGIFGGIGEAVTSLFNIDASRVIEGIETAFSGIEKVFVGAGEAIAGIFTLDFSGFWDGFLAAWDGGSNVILGIGKTFAGLFNIDFSGFWDGLISGFDSAYSYISGKFGELTSWIGGGLSSAWNWTKGLFGYGEDTDTQEKVKEQAQLQVQLQDITVLNKMSEGFSQRVAEMTAAWQPFKDSLGEGFREIYTVMQGISDRIHSIVIPAVNELVSSLSRVASEITAIVQAGNLEVQVSAPGQAMGGNVPAQYQRMAGGRNRGGYRAYAEGGIITRPHFGLVGEAGREAIIPLEKQSRGAELWLEVGRELGLISENSTEVSAYPNVNMPELSLLNTSLVNNVMPEIVNALKFQPDTNLKGGTFPASRELNMISTNSTAMNAVNTNASAQSYNVISEIVNALKFQPEISNIIPHAEGGIFSQPHIGLVAEAGREAVIPLENQARGIQLWFAAGRELGMFPDDTQNSPLGIPLWKAADETQGISFGNPSRNSERSFTLAPNITITVNGGESDSEQHYRDMFTEIFEDLYAQFQDRMQRVAFE